MSDHATDTIRAIFAQFARLQGELARAVEQAEKSETQAAELRRLLDPSVVAAAKSLDSMEALTARMERAEAACCALLPEVMKYSELFGRESSVRSCAKPILAELSALRAKVERMRNAGDVLYACAYGCGVDGADRERAVDEWRKILNSNVEARK